ncbi:Exosome complex component RRP4 [Thoreauomyces humboldtii]|nr:Exosome complex component RRP4 [Thoreauomyces humboldtii]
MSTQGLPLKSKNGGEDSMELTETDDSDKHVVTPGEVVTTDTAFMRGHGTYTQDEALVASLAGVVDRVNKLISVRPLRTRYNGEIGDVVIGRVTEVAQKRWKVDINGRLDGVLLLSSVNLPGGVQRRKNEADELQMRTFFAEGDILSSEVQNFFHDGAASLHTRNVKYGKLRNGSLVTVPSALIKRTKSHFITLPCGVDVILGLNGFIWVSKHVAITADMALQLDALYHNDNAEISDTERETIARVCNTILALAKHNNFINDTMIVYAYEAASEYPVKDILTPATSAEIVARARAQLREAQQQ